MAPPSLVDQIHELSERLRHIVAVLPQEDPFRLPTGRKPAESFLFEMKILLELLYALKQAGWTIDIERPGGEIRFVRAPAKKSTASYFRISKDGTTRQITQGTKVADRHGKERAPNICLQAGMAGMAPTYQDVLALWDAKLHGIAGTVHEGPITDAEFRSFAMVRSWLAPPLPGNDGLADWPPAFTVCALISNGKKPTEPAEVLLEAGVSVVENYTGTNSPTWPTRQQHIDSQNKKGLAKKIGP